MKGKAKRRILLIGAGGWGAVHLDVYCAHPRWQVSALADIRESALEAGLVRAGKPTPAIYRDAAEAIDRAECDAISVVVRNPFKIPILLHALSKGVPVLTEKPLAHNIADLHRVFAAARNSGAPLMVSQNYRFDGQSRRIAEFIQRRSGPWGRLRAVTVDFARAIREFGNHYVRELPGGLGLVAEMCVHHFDLMRFITGKEPSRIRAHASPSPSGTMKGWATVDAWIEFPGGPIVTYRADYETAVNRTPWGGDWRLEFENGSLGWNPYAAGAKPLRFFTPWRGRWRVELPRQPDPRTYWRTHLVSEAFNEFTAALDERRPFECNLHDNARTLAIVLAVIRAGETGRAVEFAPFLQKVLKGS